MGDICRPKARIVSVTNSDEGRIVNVKGHCYHNNQPVIEVVSSFIYRGRFTHTFDTTEEPDYFIHLESDSQGNPVLAYLQHHGTPQGLMTSLANGYSLNTPDISTTFNAPLTNEPYSKISTLYTSINPIHVNPYFSDFASLPATITHGMWSSAATRSYVESIVARSHPDRIIV
jgi:MaoC like domain